MQYFPVWNKTYLTTEKKKMCKLPIISIVKGLGANNMGKKHQYCSVTKKCHGQTEVKSFIDILGPRYLPNYRLTQNNSLVDHTWVNILSPMPIKILSYISHDTTIASYHPGSGVPPSGRCPLCGVYRHLQPWSLPIKGRCYYWTKKVKDQ